MEAGDNLIEVQRDNIKNTERDFDPAVYTAARIFNAVALPDNMPDFLKEAMEAKADQAKISAQEAGFIAADIGQLIDGKTPLEREQDKDEDTRLYVASIAQETEQRRAQEREEWARTSSTVASVTMTGAEWARLADRLRNDGDLRRRIMDAFKERGMTEQEAEARYERVAEIAEIAAIPPAQRTDEQNATMQKAEIDSTLKRDVETASRYANDEAAPSALKREFSTAVTEANKSLPAPAEIVTAPKPTTTIAGPGF